MIIADKCPNFMSIFKHPFSMHSVLLDTVKLREGLLTALFQTKRDFSNLYAVLCTGLMVLILGGFLQVFFGNELTDTALAVGGAFLFSLFIIVDTQMIMTRLSAEEYILATIQLYLDIINLFIEILKILEKVNRK